MMVLMVSRSMLPLVGGVAGADGEPCEVQTVGASSIWRCGDVDCCLNGGVALAPDPTLKRLGGLLCLLVFFY